MWNHSLTELGYFIFFICIQSSNLTNHFRCAQYFPFPMEKDIIMSQNRTKLGYKMKYSQRNTIKCKKGIMMSQNRIRLCYKNARIPELHYKNLSPVCYNTFQNLGVIIEPRSIQAKHVKLSFEKIIFPWYKAPKRKNPQL